MEATLCQEQTQKRAEKTKTRQEVKASKQHSTIVISTQLVRAVAVVRVCNFTFLLGSAKFMQPPFHYRGAA